MTTLAPCRWRSDLPIAPGRWGCASSEIHAPYGVQEKHCAACPHRDKPGAPQVADQVALRPCPECPGKVLVKSPAMETKIPSILLAKSQDGTHFNPSLLRWRDRLLFCYRAGRGGSRLHIAELDHNLMPGPSTALEISHPLASHGQDDPRLFIHQGQLHVGFVGVAGDAGPTHMLVARLDERYRVQSVTYPHYSGRASWEKNWAFFSQGHCICAVYSVRPHTVLRIDGERAVGAGTSLWNPPWSGGAMKGGAAPVLVGDEYWHFFHGTVESGQQVPWGKARDRVYNIGVYCFGAKPPWKPTRCSPAPILWADPKRRPVDFWCDCIFAAGAVLDGDKWLVSCGVHDSTCSIFEFSHRQLERLMT